MQQFQLVAARWGDSPTTDRLIEKGLRLRSNRFGRGQRSDRDRFDAFYTHLLVVEVETKKVFGYYRYYVAKFSELTQTYTGAWYNLERLRGLAGSFVDSGRLCVHRKAPSIVVFMLYDAVFKLLEEEEARTAIGCTSFDGAQPSQHRGALLRLRNRHLCPEAVRPRRKSGLSFRICRFSRFGANGSEGALPPVLSTYLRAGARVGYHAVIDLDLDTLHVPTILNRDWIEWPTIARLRETFSLA